MRRSGSLITVWGLCALLFVLRTTQPTKYALTWDVFGYYLYLPATRIHDDPGLKDHTWIDEVMATYEPSSTLYQLVDGADGARVIKYSSGMAVAYAPWFLLAHVIAEPLGYPADGFSPPYQYLVTYGTFLYVLLGLFLLRKVLLYFFEDTVVALLLVLIVLGTNFLHLAALNGTLLTHPLLFTLYAGLVLATIRWHARPSLGAAVAIGGLAGWITLVRPSEAVCLLIPLLWVNAEGFAAKWNAIKSRPMHLLIAAFAFIVAALPQLLYWHAVTGDWIFYSYVNPGEGFDFASPHIADYLFSFRKGWFVYTPLMAVAVAGLVVLWKRARHAFWAITVFLLLDLYIVASWSNWWYAGGSFSARSMVPAYVLLAIPLGFFWKELTSHSISKKLVGIIFGLLVILNLFQTWQWSRGMISTERMTGAYYAAIFGRTSIPEGATDLLMVDRPFTAEEVFTATSRYKEHTLYANDFSDRPDSVYTLGPEDPFTPGPDLPFERITDRDHAWLRTSARLWVGDTVIAPPTIVMTFHHNGESYKYRTISWTIPEGTTNQWVTASMDYITPEVRSPEDNLKVYIWNQHGGTHRVDDLRVQAFEPR